MKNSNYRLVVAAGASLALIGGLGLSHPLAAAAARGCTGSSIAGDVNGDNRGELAVTQAGRNDDAGAVHVFYGTDSGVVTNAKGRALDDQFIDQATPGVPGSNEPDDEFGAATAWGDFDADGCADLAVGAPGEDGGDGALTVVYGSPRGLGKSRPAERFGLEALFGVEPGEAHFGAVMVVGDLDHDDVADLAVGAPGLDTDPHADTGGVAVLYGQPGGGLDAAGASRAEFLTRATPGIPGEPTQYERFGAVLAAGDFDRNGVDQLAILSPGSWAAGGFGSIQVVERGPAGFTRPQPAPISQQTAQGSGGSKESDSFGQSAAAGDFNADGFADLAVGAPDRGCSDCEDFRGSGEVVVLLGSAGGLTAAGRQRWTLDSPGVPGSVAFGDAFGAVLVADELNGTDGAELAIGAPADYERRGSVTVLSGGPAGLGSARRFTQATPGVGGASGRHRFGGSLAAANIQGGGYANLVIGADRQEIDGVDATGVVNQLVASLAGPVAGGSVTLHLDTRGVKGKPETYARFGAALS